MQLIYFSEKNIKISCSLYTLSIKLKSWNQHFGPRHMYSIVRKGNNMYMSDPRYKLQDDGALQMVLGKIRNYSRDKDDIVLYRDSMVY